MNIAARVRSICQSLMRGTLAVAAKHGLIGFAKALALETAGYDITVNTICPSYERTGPVDRQIAELARHHNMPEQEDVDNIMLKPMPKRAFISIDELAGVIDFLLSDCARNITGQAIAIDGGWTMGLNWSGSSRAQ